MCCLSQSRTRAWTVYIWEHWVEKECRGKARSIIHRLRHFLPAVSCVYVLGSILLPANQKKWRINVTFQGNRERLRVHFCDRPFFIYLQNELMYKARNRTWEQLSATPITVAFKSNIKGIVISCADEWRNRGLI